MSKKLEFPVAKVRQFDGTPAIWFTHDYWLMLCRPLITAYFDARESMGKRAAKIETKTAKDWELWPFDEGKADDALRLYKIGWATYEAKRKPEDRYLCLTPEEMIERGNEREKRGREEELKRIEQAKPAPITEAVA